jgi:hypothetical protein
MFVYQPAANRWMFGNPETTTGGALILCFGSLDIRRIAQIVVMKHQ